MFTKNQLREAFPGVSQVDRRIRDLRDYGWVVHSSAEEAVLTAEDQRFVKAGVAVWDPEERRKCTPKKAIPSKERRAVFERDGFMCTLCGIAGAEPYQDDPVKTAVLSISRLKVRTLEGDDLDVLVTECNRCRSGRGDSVIDIGYAVEAANGLSGAERRRLLRWMDRGRRGMTDLDRAWAAYLRIPKGMRTDVIEQLRGDS